jgi:nitroreductase
MYIQIWFIQFLMTMTMTQTKPQKDIQYPVHHLIEKRWSGRAFADRKVENEKIYSLFEAVRWAASSMNEQPWRFIITHKGDAAYQKLFSILNAGNQLWTGDAPILILTVVKTVFSKTGALNAYALHDLGLAMGQFGLQATELGLNLHQMAGFDKNKTRELFNLPENYEPATVIALGYLGDPGLLPEKYQQSEQAPQTRKKIEEFVFENEWNNSL